MWVDGIMHKAVWEESIKKLSDEWQEFVLFGTVLMNANVGFLAIQSVDTDSSRRSPAQIASYLSVVSSIGSILLGLLLIRRHKTKTKETADEVQAYLNAHNHPLVGLETLAIIYSLPYALLMWSMVAFLTAFGLHCFLVTNKATRGVVGSLSAAVTFLILWSIWNGWESQPESNAPKGSQVHSHGDNMSHSLKDIWRNMSQLARDIRTRFSYDTDEDQGIQIDQPTPIRGMSLSSHFRRTDRSTLGPDNSISHATV